MEKVLHNSSETNAIRQRMAEVRCDLDEDVQEIVESARDLGDWRYYVKTFPWICLGAGLAAGYLIVPRHHLGIKPVAQTDAEVAIPSRLLAASHLLPTGNARRILLGFVGNLVKRQVSAYFVQRAGKLFATQPAKSQQDVQP